jgi:hypothetical protein
MNESEQRNPEEQKVAELVNSPSNRSDTETEELRIVRNADNDSLLPGGNETFIVGHVDEVNGAGAAEAASYVPTCHEVVELVKYWYRRVLDNSWFFFIFGGTGSSEWRVKAFADRRFDRAEAAIGRESVDAAIKEVREEFRTKVVKDDRLWHIFENGTAEQWDAVQAETYREWREQDGAEALKRLEQLEKESPGGFIALVLRDWPGDKCGPVLISPTDSELNAVLQASGQFQVEADKSKVRVLMVDQDLTSMGFLRARRHNGVWPFEFPYSEPGTIGWDFLESVAGKIKELLRAEYWK